MGAHPPTSHAVPAAGEPGNGSANRSPEGLQAGLKNRHLSMIAIGGVIGAGLFVGSGAGIKAAGPGILLSYALTGLLVVLVMRMLGEMAAASPTSGSFSAYADRALGRWAGFTIGWLYWFFWSVVLAVEATAAASILTGWIPAVPQWAWALLVMIVLTGTNLVSVGSFGEFEFWFAGIKVVAIVIFIVVGALAIFGLPPGQHAVGTANLLGHGGFLPKGPGAILSGMLLVVFSFMGSEIVTLAASESPNPVAAVRKAVNSVIWRIALFYIGSIAVIVTLLPWDDPEVTKSPYVAVLKSLHIPGVDVVMDVVVLTAVLSCLNSGLYTASRMAFSLGERGDAPKAFATVNKGGVPAVAIWASVAFGFIATIFSYTSKDTIFQFLLNSSGAVALFVWLVICFSQLRMRRTIEREMPERLTVRMWLYPWLTYATIALIVFVVGYMFYDKDGREQMVLSVVAAAVVLVAGLVLQKRRPRAAAGQLPGGGQRAHRQGDLDGVADQERHHADGDGLAEGHAGAQREVGDADRVDHGVAGDHRGGGAEHPAVAAAAGQCAHGGGGEQHAEDVAEGGPAGARGAAREPRHAGHAEQGVERQRQQPAAGAERGAHQEGGEGLGGDRDRGAGDRDRDLGRDAGDHGAAGDQRRVADAGAGAGVGGGRQQVGEDRSGQEGGGGCAHQGTPRV